MCQKRENYCPSPPPSHHRHYPSSPSLLPDTSLFSCLAHLFHVLAPSVGRHLVVRAFTKRIIAHYCSNSIFALEMSSVNDDERDERQISDSSENRPKNEEEDSIDEDDPKESKSSKAKKLAIGKRADQNRKAQRAFRQRKDKYIKDLELRSQELDIANSLIIQLKEENDRLNDIAKSFHSRVGELEAQLAQIKNTTEGSSQIRRSSEHYNPTSPRADERPYYSQRGGASRIQQEQQSYGPSGQVGSVYSQSQGLI